MAIVKLLKSFGSIQFGEETLKRLFGFAKYEKTDKNHHVYLVFGKDVPTDDVEIIILADESAWLQLEEGGLIPLNVMDHLHWFDPNNKVTDCVQCFEITDKGIDFIKSHP